MDYLAWEGFKKGNWMNEINVRDFIQTNLLPMKEMRIFLRAPLIERKL